ncbi:MAG TPA: glycosyltransferase family 4 protein [Candidatus Omnitrophota bacterium]|nr:glycosyltransferase family 4 protein [Candidatus Omnitrophota bacterium]
MKIKILMIDTGGWGGITHYTYNLMQALAADSQIDCCLLTDEAYELDSLPRQFKIMKRPLNSREYMPALMMAIFAVLEYKPHIIHVQTMKTARKDWFAFALARMFGLKVVLTAHNVLPHEDSEKRALFMRTAFRIIYACSHRIIVHSKFSQDTLSALFKIRRDKIRVIPHGNYLFFRTREMPKKEARQSLGLPQDKRIVLQFGALREYKGLDILLDAFAQARKAGVPALLLIVGKPINLDLDSVGQRIKALGLEKDVVLKAEYVPFEAMQTYFFSADVVVFPYKEIDMSGSLQLAYAFAKPVICARSGGLPEVVRDRENGILVRPNDSADLAQAMERILADDDIIAKMGDASYRIARDDLSWDRIAAATVRVYRDANRGMNGKEYSLRS